MTSAPFRYERSHELISRESSSLLLIDVQEKLMPSIPVRDTLVANARKLVQIAKLVGAPISATEQYAKGLGPIVPELRELFGGIAIPDKLRFSSCECLAWPTAAERTDARHQVVVTGMETHVCVQQTVLDLLAAGYQVFVPADAVASRNKIDWKIALQRMSASGAIITTTESVLFEWCEVAGTPEFKQLNRWLTGRDS